MILAGSGEIYDRHLCIFTPVYMNVIHILMRKVQYPEDQVFAGMSSEEKEQFRCYRTDISDTVVRAYVTNHVPIPV